MKKFLESIGINVPEGAVSFSTEGSDQIVFLIGNTGQFIFLSLTNHQAEEMKRAKCFGSFGWDL